MGRFDFLKKLKLLKSQELAAALLGCFFFGLSLILCLFLWDSRIFYGRLFISNRPPSLPGFLEPGGGGCDVFRGEWVWDESYPLYQARDCTPLGQGFRCTENGRPDNSYTKWRWQPKDCNLPRFDARTMLEKLRHKRLAFVGDSLGRNQWESLLCMLSSAVPNKTSIYEVNGTPINKHSGSLIFLFSDYNCTIEYHRSTFLVFQGHPPNGSHPKVKMTIRLDMMEWRSSQWKGADLLILNTGHWWNHEKTDKVGCYFQEGPDVKMEMSVEDALLRSMKTLSDWVNREVNLSKTHLIFRAYSPVHFRGCYFQEGPDVKMEMSVEDALLRSMKTLSDWVNREVNLSKTHLIFRAYSPVHFSGGGWNNGGSCHLETIPDFTRPHASPERYTEYNAVVRGLSKDLRTGSVDLLNVTEMTSRRKDGHSSLYYFGPTEGPAPLHRQDCSHWCLPGIPDTWNELLYAIFLRREMKG